MYCLGCEYDLRGLPEPRCPECGRAFDPQNPKTFLKAPVRPTPYSVLVLLWIAPLVLGASLFAGFRIPFREMLWGLGVAMCGLFHVVVPIAAAPYVGPFVLAAWLALFSVRRIRRGPIWPWAVLTWLWHIMGCAPTGFGSV